MLANLITEVSFAQPTVVLIGDNDLLSAEVANIFSQKEIPVTQFSPQKAIENLGYSGSFNQEIYKIVWVHSLVNPAGQDQIFALSEVIKTYGRPIIHVFPIVTPIRGLKIDQSEFKPWLQMSLFQEAQILSLNSALSDASFVFLQDLVLEQRREPTNAVYFCTNSSKEGKLLDPEIKVFPMQLEDSREELEDCLLRPVLSGSVLIRGNGEFSTGLIKQIQQKYQGHNQNELKILMSPVEEAEVLPFSVTGVEVEVDSFKLISVLTRLLHHPVPKINPVVILEPPVSLDPPKLSTPENIAPPIDVTPPPIQPQEVIREKPAQQTQPQSQPQSQPEPTRAKAVELEIERKKTPPPAQDNNFDVSQELQRIFDTQRTEKKVERIVKTAKKQKKIKKKSKRRTGLFYGGLGVIGLGLGVLVLAGVFMISQFFVRRQVASAIRETIETKSLSQETQANLDKYNSFLTAQLDVYGEVFDSVLLIQAISLSELGNELSEVTENLRKTRESTILYTSTILGRDAGNGAEYAQILAHSAQQAYENLSLIQARIEQIQLPISEEESKQVVEQFTEQLQKLRDALNIEKQLHPYLPTIFGQGGRRTYALILQNDQELRPTGGFIEAIALLRFEQGSLISTDVYSSYELDKKLTGVVSPPEEIKQFLGESQWYLRDSNWDPNFPATAKKIAWFIEKSEGTAVDGVMTINTKSLGALIEALGPIDIPQFNETLTHKNLSERMEFHSEVVLVESSDVEYYPKVVLSSVLNKLLGVQPDKVTAVLSAFYEQFQNHQAMINIFDDSQDILASLGWTGEIVNPACPAQISSGNCVVDEIAQVEANVGVNKANYYLKRDVNHSVKLGKEQAEHTRLIKYENTAQSNAWPKGAYKAYIRFYMPHAYELKQIKFDDEIIPTESLIEREESGRSMVGLLIEVPTAQSKNLEVVFTTPLPDQSDFSYAFFDQKQPGIENQSQVITLIPADGQHPKTIAPQADFTANGIVFSQFSEGHAFVGTRFE